MQHKIQKFPKISPRQRAPAKFVLNERSFFSIVQHAVIEIVIFFLIKETLKINESFPPLSITSTSLVLLTKTNYSPSPETNLG